VLIPFVLIFGLSLGAPLVLVRCWWRSRSGSSASVRLGGIAGVFNTIGAFVGPVGAGKIYDLTGSYVPAFEAFVVMCCWRGSNLLVPKFRVGAVRGNRQHRFQLPRSFHHTISCRSLLGRFLSCVIPSVAEGPRIFYDAGRCTLTTHRVMSRRSLRVWG